MKLSMPWLVFLFSFFWILPHSALAHEVKTFGELSVLLHMNPNDDPIVGEKADLFFAFRDEAKAFTFENCECRVIVSKSDHPILDEILSSADPQIYGSNVGTASLIFPEKGIYSVALSGKAKDFSREPFSLSYDVRVDRERQAKNSRPLLSLSAIIYLVGFFSAFLIVILNLRKPHKIKRVKK